MRQFLTDLKERFMQLDFVILSCVLLLSFIGIFTLWGARDVYGSSYFKVQIIATVLGLIALFVISTLDYQRICDALAVPFFVFSCAALIFTLIMGSVGEFGGKSWLKFDFLPFNIQTSEFCKPLIIISFSKHLEKVRSKINSPLTILGLALHAGAIVGLIILQDDLGTALVYMAFVLVMMFAAGLSLWYYIIGGGLIIAALPFLWSFLGDYQQRRILVGFNPELDPTGKGMQALMSRRAISAGGFWGVGINNGSAYEDVPFAHTDFILSIIGEKLGFIGIFAVLAIFTVLICRMIYVALHTRKDYGAYICTGIATMIIAQSAENIGMCLAMLPVIGITLPFVSYGGSSVLSLYITIGVFESICTHNNKYFFEREEA